MLNNLFRILLSLVALGIASMGCKPEGASDPSEQVPPLTTPQNSTTTTLATDGGNTTTGSSGTGGESGGTSAGSGSTDGGGGQVAAPGTLVVNAFSNMVSVDSLGNVNPVVNADTESTNALSVSGTIAIATTQSGAQLTSSAGKVSKFLVAPGRQFFTLFDQPLKLPDSDTCILARVSEVGAVTCVDQEIGQVIWDATKNPPIQFDDDGNAYYMGNAGGKAVIRKWINGSAVELINDNITISDFIVRGDGSVLLMGESSTGLKWIRLLTSSGGIQSVSTTKDQRFIRIFPDGNFYFGGILPTPNTWGVYRIFDSDLSVDSRQWIGNSADNPFNVCDTSDAIPYAFRGYCGAAVENFFFSSSTLFAIAGWSGETALYQYFPLVEEISTSISVITDGIAAGSKLVLAGVDGAGGNKLVLFDPQDDSEIDLLGVENVEVYNMALKSQTEVLFEGLDFSNNSLVVGTAKLDGSGITKGSSLDNRFDDLQTFDQ